MVRGAHPASFVIFKKINVYIFYKPSRNGLCQFILAPLTPTLSPREEGGLFFLPSPDGRGLRGGCLTDNFTCHGLEEFELKEAFASSSANLTPFALHPESVEGSKD
jgi:hypothetical protein